MTPRPLFGPHKAVQGASRGIRAGKEHTMPEITVEKTEQVNFALFSPRFTITGGYSDHSRELNITWEIDVHPQQERWEFVYWERDVPEAFLYEFERDQFEEHINVFARRVIDAYNTAVQQMLASVPALGADMKMTTKK